MSPSKMVKRHRIPPEIIQAAAWLYHRFNLSHSDVEDLMVQRGMRKFKSLKQAQRFSDAHAAVYNLFNLGRHLVSAENYRHFRLRAFATWGKAVAKWEGLIGGFSI
jgi:putative transposase